MKDALHLLVCLSHGAGRPSGLPRDLCPHHPTYHLPPLKATRSAVQGLTAIQSQAAIHREARPVWRINARSAAFRLQLMLLQMVGQGSSAMRTRSQKPLLVWILNLSRLSRFKTSLLLWVSCLKMFLLSLHHRTNPRLFNLMIFLSHLHPLNLDNLQLLCNLGDSLNPLEEHGPKISIRRNHSDKTRRI